MTVTKAAKAIRAHLLKYWEHADAWKHGVVFPWGEAAEWPHKDCLITLGEPMFSSFLPDEKTGGGLLHLLGDDGKDAVLAYLDTLILGGIK